MTTLQVKICALLSAQPQSLEQLGCRLQVTDAVLIPAVERLLVAKHLGIVELESGTRWLLFCDGQLEPLAAWARKQGCYAGVFVLDMSAHLGGLDPC